MNSIVLGPLSNLSSNPIHTAKEADLYLTQGKVGKYAINLFVTLASLSAATLVISSLTGTIAQPFALIAIPLLVASYAATYFDFRVRTLEKPAELILPNLNHGKLRDCRIVMDAQKINSSLQKQLERAERQQKDQTNTSKIHYTSPTSSCKISEQFHTKTFINGAVTHAKGKRPSQEDEDIHSLFFIKDPKGQTHKVQLNGIFDGHGGGAASKYLKEHLQNRLMENFDHFSFGTLKGDLVPLNAEKELSDVAIWNILKLTCVQLSEEIKALTNAGSTASFSLVIDENLWTANVGDSRTLLVGNGITLQLTEDAKPEFNFPPHLSQDQFEEFTNSYASNEAPFNRSIWKRTGFVLQKRVDWNLAVARAFGDAKVTGVTARPKITKVDLKQLRETTGCDKWILANACDGVFDVLSSNQVGEVIINNGQEPLKELTEKIVNTAIQKGSKDNVSISLLKLSTTEQ